jgi:predicted O-methyltransferase YrrM
MSKKNIYKFICSKIGVIKGNISQLWQYPYKYHLVKKYENIFNIFTHLTEFEKIVLYKIAKKKNKEAIFVEIGSYLGASSCFLAAGMKSGKLYCIDTWQNDAMSEGSQDTLAEFRGNVEKYKDKIVEMRGLSYDIIGKLKGMIQSIDLLFIDGDHSYNGVKKDWDLYSPLLKNGSIVVFHDYGWAEGVQKVVHEDVMKNCRKFKSLPNMWWGEIKQNRNSENIMFNLSSNI